MPEYEEEVTLTRPMQLCILKACHLEEGGQAEADRHNGVKCVPFQDADVIERLNERGELRNILRPFKVKKSERN